MTKEQAMTGQNGGAVPVACALTQAGLAAQSARWQRLAARALTDRADTPDGVRLAFRPGPEALHQMFTGLRPAGT